MGNAIDNFETGLDLFKDLVWDNLVEAALAALFVKVPVLAWGPLGAIIKFAATKFTDYLYAGMKMFIVVEAIPLRNKLLHKKYTEAAIKLKTIAKTTGIESDEFRKARNEDKKRLSDLVRFAA